MGVASISPVVADSSAEATSVDEVIATTVAANLAQSTNLSVASNALEFAISAQTKSEFLQTDTTVISKPEILQVTAENRSVQSYTVKPGDTVAAVAAQYGISADTIKWANNLTTDTLTEGKILTILPTDGIEYTVRAGDTLESISTKYSIDQTRLVLYNDLDESGIVAGQKVILPGANLPANERPGYVAPVVTYNTPTPVGGGGSSNVKLLYINTKSTTRGNTASYGYCTWYVWERRVAMGKPLPSGAVLGNAADWVQSLGGRYGYTVVRGVPVVGAMIQNAGGIAGAGHVGIVESIAENGDLTVTDMNYIGWNNVSQRTVTAGQAANYNFIY